MAEYRLKIVGVHYAVNAGCSSSDESAEVMEERTIAFLRSLDEERPHVVLRAEPSNPYDSNAVMARAKGRMLGYVEQRDLPLAHRLLACSGVPMLCVDIKEVDVRRRGWLWVTVEADAAEVERAEVKLSSHDWREWRCAIPSLDPCERWLAMEEAEFMLADLLEHPTAGSRPELMQYMTVWIDSNLHDLSRDTKQLRGHYMERLRTIGDNDLVPLIKRIDKQRVALLGDHRRGYRMQWWRDLVDSPQMNRYWTRWTSRMGCDLWRDLREVDKHLRSLPDSAYDYVGALDQLFSRLYSLDVPREVLWNIYTLLLLRQRLCRALDIPNQPLAPDAYQIEEDEDVPVSTPVAKCDTPKADDVPNQNPTMPAAPSPRERAGGEASFESVIRAAEMCQTYFCAQSSWAVVYCVCRDHLAMDMTMSEFECRVAEYPLKPKTKPCPEGTIRKTLSNNPDMNAPIRRWPEGRAKILAEALIKALEE